MKNKRYITKEIKNLTLEETENLSFNRNVLKEFSKVFHKKSSEFDKKRFARKYEKQLRISELTKIFNDKCHKLKYELPSKLINKIEQIIQLEYFNEFTSADKRKYNVYKNKLEQALYICIAIHKYNVEKLNEDELTPEIHYEYDVKKGCQLSKNILTKIIGNKALYTVKRILAKYNILRKCTLI